MARVHNFSAGPAALPEEVLSEVADELLDYRGNGMSVLEMSHRSRPYSEIIEDAEATLRRLMGIPSGYRVLFLQGGATLQFSGIPMNLMRTRRAGYVVSGLFSRLAKEEAQRYGDVEVLASSEDTGFDRIPDLSVIPERTAAGAGSTTSTYARTTPSSARCFTSCRRRARCRSSRTSRAASSPPPSTSSATGSSTRAPRRTPASPG